MTLNFPLTHTLRFSRWLKQVHPTSFKYSPMRHYFYWMENFSHGVDQA